MNNGPTLQAGSTGLDVKRLQRLLVEMKILDFTHIDGNFAAATETAVKDFQEGNGLAVDGIVGPVTWAVLPADPMTPTLSRGSSGASVSALQRGLKTYAGQNPEADPGAIDGSFGPRPRRRSKPISRIAALPSTASSAIAPGGCRPERLARRSHSWLVVPLYKSSA